MILVRRIAVAGAALLLAGCTDAVSPSDSFPTFVGTWAGKDWTGSASAYVVKGGASGDTLYVFASSPANAGPLVREYVRARIVLRGTGAYPLGPDAARFEELVGGDVVSASYMTTSTNTGTLTLLHYTGVGGMAEGKIEFEAVSSSPYGSYGPKASMTNAYFSAPVHSSIED